jgi:hypothetical protein
VPATADYLVHDASAASVLVAVLRNDRPGRARDWEAAAAYRTSARDAFLSGNGTDPMHGRRGIETRPTMNRPRGSTKPEPPRKKSPDPTHLHPVDGSYASQRDAQKTFPLNPERPRKPTIRAAKSCRLQQRPAGSGVGRTMRKGSKCGSKSRPWTKVWTMSTPPLAGQTRDERTLPGSQKAAIRGRSSKRTRLRHVVTTTLVHE